MGKKKKEKVELKAPPEITKEFIFKRVNQEAIFERYLGVAVDLRGMIRSPLRRDKNPTCTFKWIKGKLRFRDWAVGETWDCFDIVMMKYHVNYYEALNMIARDFDLLDKAPSPKIVKERKKRKKLAKKAISEKPRIVIKRQEFTKTDVEYLKSFHITRKMTEFFKVFSPRLVWLNGKQVYRYKESDPALAYYFGTDKYNRQKWKIYFYKRKGRKRFLCNTNRINGIVQLPKKASTLVLTKSLKDVMVLYRLKVPAIAMQNETMLPYDYIIEGLRSRFKEIYSLYDFDYTGIRTANKIKRMYGIRPLFLFNGRFGSIDYGAKDISDYAKEFGLEEAAKLVVHCFDILSLEEYYAREEAK